MKKILTYGAVALLPMAIAGACVAEEYYCNPSDGPYFSLGLGLNKIQRWKADEVQHGSSFKQHPSYRFAIGSQISNIRIEFEPTFSKRAKYTTSGTKGKLAMSNLMGNIYLDVPYGAAMGELAVSPYVGAGIGVSRFRTHSIDIMDDLLEGQPGGAVLVAAPHAAVKKGAKSHFALSYQGIAGLKFAMNEEVSFNVEYRYFTTEKINTKSLSHHGANIGLRYKF